MKNINHPDHYNQGSVEVIDIIESYNLRSDFKEDRESDLRKALWYLNRELENGSR